MKRKRSNRLLNAGYLAADGLVSRFLPPKKPHIVIACMPKTASTFLAATIAEIPGIEQATLVPAWEQREQELCPIQLSHYNRRQYVAQCHLRYSRATEFYFGKFGIIPAVLVRNLADCAVSLRDHFRKDPEPVPYVNFSDIQKNMPDEAFEEAIVRFALPWYINFYVGWRQAKAVEIYDFDDLTSDPAKIIRDIFARADYPVEDSAISKALDRSTASSKTRFNVGKTGRGRQLSSGAKEALLRLLDFYPDFKDDPLFVKTRATLERPAD
ncbi:MAG: hypothetical protein EP348_12330 [Alphaproteobacteria bacterium]|nr:MAG: hypothetical protein EP348_12330 [Alphaproteobacteria bacterium]